MHKNSGSDSQPCFVYNSVLVYNSAFRRDGFGYGGGIYSEAGVVFDNVVYNNNGGGICVYDETSIVNNTIVNNQLYGIGRPADTDVAGSSISVSNSVIWSINPLNHAGLKGFDALVDRVSNCAIVDWDETKGNDNISLLPYNDHTGSVPNFINPTHDERTMPFRTAPYTRLIGKCCRGVIRSTGDPHLSHYIPGI